jgi:hypothetical protein
LQFAHVVAQIVRDRAQLAGDHAHLFDQRRRLRWGLARSICSASMVPGAQLTFAAGLNCSSIAARHAASLSNAASGSQSSLVIQKIKTHDCITGALS